MCSTCWNFSANSSAVLGGGSVGAMCDQRPSLMHAASVACEGGFACSAQHLAGVTMDRRTGCLDSGGRPSSTGRVSGSSLMAIGGNDGIRAWGESDFAGVGRCGCGEAATGETGEADTFAFSCWYSIQAVISS